jgi:hypothetical protein
MKHGFKVKAAGSLMKYWYLPAILRGVVMYKTTKASNLEERNASAELQHSKLNTLAGRVEIRHVVGRQNNLLLF